MEDIIKELNDKINNLENRVTELEEIKRKRKVRKLSTSIITLVIVFAVIVIYIYLFSKIYGNYINMF